ncbi:hypothetical protein AAFN88_10760 [Pelagibius sp. CAU 1746]|uniref:hypothetical protein n=1 Tax=Pelagibius sp. CAU 1746 TaxID=3140370 RepID=UPI00325A6335
MATQSSSGTQPPNFLLRYWRGEGELWKVFWLYGVLASTVLACLYAAAIYAGNLAAAQLLLPLLLVYTAWIVISVWRCAPNVGWDFYTHLSRGLTIAWALNVIFALLGLQMDLLAVYAGPPA